MKNTVKTFIEAKGKTRLSMLTAYDYSIARIIDQCGINGILVGDSLGMTMLGYSSTVPVTLDDMIHHCAAVARGAENALLVCDMPFLSSQCSIRDTVYNAGKLLKEGNATAVKLEGGKEYAEEIKALAKASIPVMGHIGLMPQSINMLGDYKSQGKNLKDAQKILEDAQAVANAGAFAIVLECVPASLARLVTETINIPTIGIGSGCDCDGQVLVWQDMLGITAGRPPRFVRRFAEAGMIIRDAFKEFDAAVKNCSFPAPEHCYNIDSEILEKIHYNSKLE